MILEGKNIDKSFGNKKVLENVSFTVERGKITGLIGRNGSGKTTLLKILSQIYDTDKGDVMLDGKVIKLFPELKENIAYLPDNFNYFDYESIERALEYYSLIYPNFDKDYAENELKNLGYNLNDHIRNLSKGNKSMVGLIMVLATRANYILIDEVLDGMDVLNKEKILRYLLQAVDENRGVIVSSHELGELEGVADNIIYLSLDGRARIMKSASGLDVSKIQIVVKEKLPKSVSLQAIIRSHVGRVYTVLLPGNKENWEIILEDDDVVQYDFLPVKLEDLFYFERGKEKTDARI